MQDRGEQGLVREVPSAQELFDFRRVRAFDFRRQFQACFRAGEPRRHLHVTQRPHHRPGPEFADVAPQQIPRRGVLTVHPPCGPFENGDTTRAAIRGARLAIKHDVGKRFGRVSPIIVEALSLDRRMEGLRTSIRIAGRSGEIEERPEF